MERFEIHRITKTEARDNMLDAEDQVDELFERGVRPTITVPAQYVNTLKNGLSAHATWIPDLQVIAGTMGTDPYLPSGEERVVVEVTNIDRRRIHARLTGVDRAFHGVVVIDGPIPPESIRIISGTMH